MTDGKKGSTDDLRLAVVESFSGTGERRAVLIAALLELEAFRAAKSEHKRTRRLIREYGNRPQVTYLQQTLHSKWDGLVRALGLVPHQGLTWEKMFEEVSRLTEGDRQPPVQWEPESMVEERERLKQALKYEGDVAAQAIADLKKARAEVDDFKARLKEVCDENARAADQLFRVQARNQTLEFHAKTVCDENARLASKANGVEDEHAKFVKAMAEALGVPEGETRSLVGVASELRRHADAANQRCSEAQAAAVALAGQCDELRKAKVTTNADVCAVEALEEKLAEAERQRGIAHRACIMNQDSYEASLASMRAECGRLQKRVDEVEEENTRYVRIFDAVRALMVKR